MNQNRIDKIGVAAVVNYFCRLGYIDPHITFDDKVPVWDGNIDIHKSIDSNSKDDIEFNLYVQVKSSEYKSNNFNTYTTHNVDIHDLKLYKDNGGTLLIKVLINKNKSQLYFAYLSKVKINELIEGVSETQKTKSIRFHKAPKLYRELYQKLHTIHLQSIYNLISPEELKGKEGWSFNITVGPMDKDTNPFEWMAKNYTDVLVKLPDLSEQFYLSTGPAQISTKKDVCKAVSVEGVEYFSQFACGNNSEGYFICIDNFLRCQYYSFEHNKDGKTRIDVKITPSSKYVDEFINQLRFMNAVIEHKYFCIGDIRFEVPINSFTENKISSLKSDIDFFEKINSFLEKMGISSHFNFKDLKEEDFKKLEFLVKLFSGIKVEPLPNIETPISCFQIGEYNLCFGVTKLDGGNYRFYYLEGCESGLVCDKSEKCIDFPAHSYLFSKNIFPDNLNYDGIVNEYERYNIDEDNLMIVNNDALKLISQYDLTKKMQFINAAEKIINWLISVTNDENHKNIFRINLLQIYARLGKVYSDDDRKFLFYISNLESNELNFAASVLLGEQLRAETIFEQFTENELLELMQYPIYHLYKKLGNNFLYR